MGMPSISKILAIQKSNTRPRNESESVHLVCTLTIGVYNKYTLYTYVYSFSRLPCNSCGLWFTARREKGQWRAFIVSIIESVLDSQSRMNINWTLNFELRRICTQLAQLDSRIRIRSCHRIWSHLLCLVILGWYLELETSRWPRTEISFFMRW